jgi:hypothetical protein
MNRYLLIAPLTILVLVASVTCGKGTPAGPSVEEQFGNVLYNQGNGIQRQITAAHTDGQPVLSPNGRTIAFIRIEGKSTTRGESDFMALWLADGPSGATRRLVGSSANNDPNLNLQSLNHPTFSLDGHFIYVLADAWATSAAVHQVDTDTGAERFVIDGNTDVVIRTGPYRGCLLVSRHKYHPAPAYGSYDPVDVVRPDGHVAFAVPGTENDDDLDHVAIWLRQHGWQAW